MLNKLLSATILQQLHWTWPAISSCRINTFYSGYSVWHFVRTGTTCAENKIVEKDAAAVLPDQFQSVHI